MRSPANILLILLLAGGALTWWLLGDDAITPPTNDEVPEAKEDRNDSAPETSAEHVRAEQVDRQPSGDDNAVDPRRRHRDDATWVDIQAVDAAGAPIPHATIYWYDNKASDLLEADATLDGVERMLIYRQPCELARRHGWTVQADEAGRARITLFDPSYVAGTARDLYGFVELDPSTPTPDGCHRLVLEPDASLTLLVLDEQDQPCSGVPVTLAVFDDDAALLGNYGLNAMARTNGDGIAVIAHVFDWRRQMFRDPEMDDVPRKAHVYLMLPQHEQPGPEVDLYNPTKETIVLRMPTCGTVKARVDLPGIPAKNKHEIVLTGDGSQKFSGYMVSRTSDDGWTHFHNVPVQKRYRVNSTAARGITKLIDGPTYRGEVVEVVVSVPNDRVLLRARILDADGKPVANEVFSARLEGQHVPHHVQFRTDEDANVLMSIPFDTAADLVAIDSGTVTVIGATTGYGTATIEPVTLRPGVFDLGDLTLKRGELIAAGRLMAGAEPYTKPISVAVQSFDPTAEPARQWRQRHKVVARFDEGRFEIHGNLPRKDYRLQFHGLHNQPVDPVPFRIGQRDLVVQIPVGHAVSASFLLPTGIEADAVLCHLVPEQTLDQRVTDRLQSYPDRGQGERCTARWHGLPAGDYTLELSLWAQPKPLARIENVTLPAPPDGDARLIDIDLRNLVQIVTVNCVDPDGKPLDGYGALFPPEQMVDGKWRGYPVFGARTRLLLPAGPVQLVAALESYQQTPVKGSGAVRTVRMFPWPQVKFRLAQPAALPGKLKVLMQLEGPPKRDDNWFGPNSEDSLAALFGTEFRAWPLENDEIQLQIGEGAHRLRVFVGTIHRFAEVKGATPTQVLPTERNVTVTVPKASWQAAIDAIGK